MTVDQCTIMFDASESGETSARCEGAQGVLRGGAWHQARGRDAPVGRGMPSAVSCDNRYENLMERY